jgi:hypothetical protein
METLQRLFPEKYWKLIPLLIVGGMFGCSVLQGHILNILNALWVLLTFVVALYLTARVLAPKLLPIDEDSAEEVAAARQTFFDFLQGPLSGWRRPILTLVRNGKVVKPHDHAKVETDEEEITYQRGVILTDSTSVIALRTGTGVSRIVGPGPEDEGKVESGVIFTDFEEEIDSVIDLRPQLRTELITAQTREGIPVEVRVTAIFTLHGTKSRRMRELADPESRWPFTWRRASVMQAIHSRRIVHKGEEEERTAWNDRVMAIAIPTLRQLIARYSLDYLTAPLTAERHPRFDIRQELIKRVQHELDTSDEFNRGTGIQVRFMAVSVMRPPHKVIQQRIDAWKQDWHKRETEILGQAEADAVSLREQARAQAQGELTARINDALQEAKATGTLNSDLITLRFLESMEKMAKDPTTRALLTFDSLNILQQLREMLK